MDGKAGREMEGSARNMLQLKKGNKIAFADKDHRWLLEALRRNFPEMKGGRITEILQCRPDLVTEGKVMEQT